jgi:hypothetical protein
MKKLIWLVSAVLSFATVSFSQEAATRARTTTRSETAAAVTQDNKAIDIASGTRITGELQNNIDVRKAKVGDEVVLKTSQAIKSSGQIVVNKGARLFGRITEVTQKTKDNNQSRLGLVFDRLEQGSLEVPIVASITSVSARHAAVGSDDSEMASSDVSTRSTSRSQGSGGLIGGVTNTVTSTTGAVVGATTNAVGTAVRETSNVVGGVTGSAGSLGRIQITESADASVATGSVLSLRGDNIRLDKGTTINLMLTQSASVEKN